MWKGFWSDACNCICLRRARPANSQWLVALDHFDSSAVLAWLVLAQKLRDHNGVWHSCLEFQQASLPTLEPIFEFDNYESFSFTFKAWSLQQSEILEAQQRLALAVRAFVDSETMPILRSCARRAWFGMSRSDLVPVAEHCKSDPKAFPSLLDLLCKLTSQVLGADDEVVMNIVSQRFGNYINTTMYAEAILEVDEAAKTLDDGDKDDLKKVQLAQEQQKCDLNYFKASFKAKQRSMMGKQLKKKTLSKYKGPKVFALNSQHLEQEQIKQLFPEGSSVWRARGTDSWYARYSSMPSRCCKDTAWVVRSMPSENFAGIVGTFSRSLMAWMTRIAPWEGSSRIFVESSCDSMQQFG